MCNTGAQTPSSSRTGGILVIHLEEIEIEKWSAKSEHAFEKYNEKHKFDFFDYCK